MGDLTATLGESWRTGRLGRYLILTYAILPAGCGPSSQPPAHSGSAQTVEPAAQPESLERPFLPFSLQHVLRDSEFRISESHGMKGVGWFWSLGTPDGGIGVDIDAIDALHLTKVTISIKSVVNPTGNLASALQMLQVQIRRVFFDESGRLSEWPDWSGTTPSLPFQEVHGQIQLKVKSEQNGDLVATLLPIDGENQPPNDAEP